VANINQNRWDQLVRRVAGLIGPGSKVNNTIGDLFPMLDVENLPGELFLLAGTRLGTGGAAQIAAAGEVPRVQLFNPADSRLIATLTSIVLVSSATQTIRYVHTITPESTNTNNQRVRDTRLGVAQETTLEVRAASTVATLAATGEFRIVANEPYKQTDPDGLIVLGPGTGITYLGLTVATTLRANFYWRERVAESSELQF
jgi:hypothetical protein